ncbi:uncharacterized protein K02A2.6-like [Zophobas morio]|uniref:uncharacterized protein K02A2.6-like n=1 Tax=Zophobas morio TaxID=2755281 RepID=UPI0030827FC4
MSFKGYTGESIVPLGFINVIVEYGDMASRDFINNFNIIFTPAGINAIDSVVDVKTTLRGEFPDVCTSALGCFKHGKISLKLKPNAVPKHHSPKPVPLALKSKVEYELERMIQRGIITPTVTAEWSSHIVPVLRKNGTVRICGSYINLNKNLVDVYYPLPRIDQIYANLKGNYKFSKIDLSDAYMQFELICVKKAGHYIHAQRIIHGIDNVFTFQDDILIGHKRGENHLDILRRALTILKNAGLTVNLDKCQFLQSKISYLGYDLSENGLSKSKDKIEAITSAPPPNNITELKSFIGVVNYYSKFIPNITETLAPLYQLLKKDVKYQWTDKCDTAFRSIKQKIASDTVLTYFDPNLPIIVTCDASERGIAAVLAHKMTDNTEKMVTCVSRTYTKAEQNYSVVHKESLACYFAINKFQEYLYGQRFILRTDQKSLVYLFGKQKEINQTYANRIKRYALYFSNFDFQIEHIKGRDNAVADCLSRLPLDKQFTVDEVEYNSIYFSNVDIPIDNTMVKEETANDAILTKVIEFVRSGWPNEIDENYRPFYNRKLDLHVVNGCLLFGDRIVIPTTMREIVKNELHSTHEGIVRMKAMARSFLWFPGVDKEIEQICKSCKACLSVTSHPPKTYVSWPESSNPFELVHMDFFTFLQRQYLIIVDSCTKWLEIYSMKNITSESTVEMLRDCFSRFGLPETVVSDNGPSFVSEEMEIFFYRNGIKHMTISPYNPQSNGLAENGVKIVKNKLKSALADEQNKNATIQTILSRFLLVYRNTPHTTTKISPASAMFGRELRTRFHLMTRTDHVSKKIPREPTTSRTFKINDKVIIRDYRTTERKWVDAKIIKTIGNATHLCQLASGTVWKRHPNQIKKRSEGCESVLTKSTAIKQHRGHCNVKIGMPINYDPALPQLPIPAPVRSTSTNLDPVPAGMNNTRQDTHPLPATEPMCPPAAHECIRPSRIRKTPKILDDFIVSM